jgi:hypothetical protein
VDGILNTSLVGYWAQLWLLSYTEFLIEFINPLLPAGRLLQPMFSWILSLPSRPPPPCGSWLPVADEILRLEDRIREVGSIEVRLEPVLKPATGSLLKIRDPFRMSVPHDG